MTPPRVRILLLENNPADAELLQNELRRAGIDVKCTQVTTESDFIQHIEADYDLILADYHLPGFNGMQALKIVRSRRDTPFILVSGAIRDDEAVEAIRNGADDYLLKDRLARLGPAVARALEQRQLRADEARAKQALEAAEERYRVLVETSRDAVIIVNERGVIEYANSALKRIFGYAPKDVAGRQLAMLQPPRLRDESPIFRKELDFTAHDATGQLVEAVGLHRDGREFPVEVVFSNMILAGRQQFAFFLRDITERKKHQQASLTPP